MRIEAGFPSEARREAAHRSGIVERLPIATAGLLILLASESAYGSAYQAMAVNGFGRAIYLLVHFLGLHCLSVAVVGPISGSRRRDAGNGHSTWMKAMCAGYVTLGLHYLVLGIHTGDSHSLLTLKTDFADIVFYGTLWAPIAKLTAGAQAIRATGS